MDAQGDAAPADLERGSETETDGDGAVALANRDQERDSDIRDHRVGGVAAGEAHRVDRLQMLVDAGTVAVDNDLHQLDQQTAAENGEPIGRASGRERVCPDV